VAPTLSSLVLAYPAAQELADLGHHAAHMRILSVVDPCPMVGKSQIKAQSVECGIRSPESTPTLIVAAGLSGKDRFLAIKGCIHQAQGDGTTMRAREMLNLGHQPGKQIEETCQQNQILCH